jgi:WD40 repeat protein
MGQLAKRFHLFYKATKRSILYQTVRIWNGLSEMETVPALRGHEGPIKSVAFHHSGKFIISGSDDKTVRIWNVSSGCQVDHYEIEFPFDLWDFVRRGCLLAGQVFRTQTP